MSKITIDESDLEVIACIVAAIRKSGKVERDCGTCAHETDGRGNICMECPDIAHPHWRLK